MVVGEAHSTQASRRAIVTNPTSTVYTKGSMDRSHHTAGIPYNDLEHPGVIPVAAWLVGRPFEEIPYRIHPHANTRVSRLSARAAANRDSRTEKM